jgi:hypothetical protein
MAVLDKSRFVLVKGQGIPSRSYYDKVTGDVISRRQADKISTGLTNEQRAARTPVELRELKPGRQRGKGKGTRSRQKRGAVPRNPSRLQPLIDTSARRVSAGSTARSYDRVLAGLRRNPGISGIAPMAVFSGPEGQEKYVWMQAMTFPSEVMSGEAAAEFVGLEREGDDEDDDDEDEEFSEPEGLIQSLTYAGLQFANFAFHVHFKDEVYRKNTQPAVKKRKKRKKPGPKRKRK